MDEIVTPVVCHRVRGLCAQRYNGHSRGCPNFNKKKGCPPAAPYIEDVIDLDKEIWVIWNEFPIGDHAKRMWKRHSNWSHKQAYCCLYWQGTARKQLKKVIMMFLRKHRGLRVVQCPEAVGVDLTATMASIGIELEWPPRKIARQIVLAGFSKRGN